MKSMKNLFVIGLTLVICAGFTACGNDDDKQKVTLPTIFEGKRITQCESTTNGYTEKDVYSYNSGKLIVSMRLVIKKLLKINIPLNMVIK